MTIIINANGKAYNLRMRVWTGDNWSEDMSEAIIIDNSFAWDDDAEAWRMSGQLDNLTSFLQDWEHYSTEADIDAYDDEERALRCDEHPRYYELDEINE